MGRNSKTTLADKHDAELFAEARRLNRDGLDVTDVISSMRSAGWSWVLVSECLNRPEVSLRQMVERSGDGATDGGREPSPPQVVRWASRQESAGLGPGQWVVVRKPWGKESVMLAATARRNGYRWTIV